MTAARDYLVHGTYIPGQARFPAVDAHNPLWGQWATLKEVEAVLDAVGVRACNLGDEPVYYGDLQHLDKANREVKIIGDGACPPSLAVPAGNAG